MGIVLFFQFMCKRIISRIKTVVLHRIHQKYATNLILIEINTFYQWIRIIWSYKMLFHCQYRMYKILSKLKAKMFQAIGIAISIFIGSLNGTFELYWKNIAYELWRKMTIGIIRSNCEIRIDIVTKNNTKSYTFHKYYF